MKCNLCNKESEKMFYNLDYEEPICKDCADKILEEMNKTSRHKLYIEDVFFPYIENNKEVEIVKIF